MSNGPKQHPAPTKSLNTEELSNLQGSLTDFLDISVTFVPFKFKESFPEDVKHTDVLDFVNKYDEYPWEAQANPIINSFVIEHDQVKSEIFESYEALRNYRKGDVCDTIFKINDKACRVCTACDMFHLLKACLSREKPKDHVKKILLRCWMGFSGAIFVSNKMHEELRWAVMLGQFVANPAAKQMLETMLEQPKNKAFGFSKRDYNNLFYSTTDEGMQRIAQNCSMYPSLPRGDTVNRAAEMFERQQGAYELALSLELGRSLAQCVPHLNTPSLINIIIEFAKYKKAFADSYYSLSRDYEKVVRMCDSLIKREKKRLETRQEKR